MGLMTGYNMTKEEYEITQAVLTRLDKFESELESLLLDLEPLDLSRLDTVVREETLEEYIACGIVKIDGQPLLEENEIDD
ncbi:hypothetical protein LVP14_002824 [Enterococcus faecalis]|nr:hypothetical protein [Enterococcus faecalis]EKI8146193.1 hypothetical protein [Enterococcus faecalis]